VIRKFAEGSKIPVVGMIPYDPDVRNAELFGIPLILAFPSSMAVREIELICDRLIEMENIFKANQKHVA
ncbi:MAG: hypothetical protein QXL67_05195, partial [Candidatus Bathyarchaeia archaeon]